MNLLPDTEKKSLKKGLRLRFIVVLLLLVMGASLISITALVPAYVLARVRFVEVASTMNAEPPADTGEVSRTLTLPEEINQKLTLLETNIPKYRAAEVFYAVAEAAPDGVSVSSMSFLGTATPGRKSKEINVSGKSQSRQSLIDFSERLKANSLVSLVEVPVSSFAKEKDLPFSIKIILVE